MNKCCQIVAIGKVQDIGFRGRIENFGRGFDLRGQVQNENNGSVKILCGGEDEAVDNFTQVIRKVTVKANGNMLSDNIIEEKTLPLDMYDYLPYPFGKVHTDTEEDIGRKLDIGNDFLRSINGTTLAIKSGIDNLNTKFESFIVGQTEHNSRLETILEKLTNK